MKLMAISTSSSVASAALVEDGKLLCMRAAEEGPAHSETVLPLAEEMLREANTELSELSAIVVDVGPGSFTGVRIGVATANALGFALNLPVVAVDSLTSLYYARRDAKSVCVLLDARNGNGYAATFLNGSRVFGPEAVTVSEYLRSVPHEALFLGDGAEKYREEILSVAPCASFDEAHNRLSAANTAFAAHDLLQTSKGEPEVKPLYLRPSQAERMYEAKHGNR